jgi:hypothetical protein
MRDNVLALVLAPARARWQLKALLLRGDPEFVRCAYLSAVGREPTEQEFSRALQRLGACVPRIAILNELLNANTAASGRRGSRWLRQAFPRMPANPLPWLFRLRAMLRTRRHISADAYTAFVRPERVPPVQPEVVAERVYRELSAAAAGKRR